MNPGTGRRWLIIWICLHTLSLLATSGTVAQGLPPQFSDNPVTETAVVEELGRSFSTCDYVSVTMAQVGDPQEFVPVQISEYDLRGLIVKREPSRTWSSLVRTPEVWESLSRLLLDNSRCLTEVSSGTVGTETKTPAQALLYYFPKPIPLRVGRAPLTLSTEAQQYLHLQQMSKALDGRNVLVVEEPHYDVEGQCTLLRGLGILFRDNPAMIGQTVFLSEGHPAGEPLSVEPLVRAEPKPDDSLIRRILSTYLITGYMAYEWKAQQSIPIVGFEDPKLYNMSANLWLQVQAGKRAGRSSLWNNTVIARNESAVKTLLGQMERAEYPILFIGGLHTQPLGSEHQIRSWAVHSDVMADGDLEYLKDATKRSVPGLLSDRDVGYYFLTCRRPPIQDNVLRSDEMARYERLFRSQLTGNPDSYIEFLSRESEGGVTVAPSPTLAARVVQKFKGSPHSDDSGGTPAGGKPGWLKQIGDFLQKLGKNLRGISRQLAITIDGKIQSQLAKRGWTRQSVQDTVNKAPETIPTTDARHMPDGSKRDEPATAYINSDGSYVVRNDATGDIVQVSDRNDPNWKRPF